MEIPIELQNVIAVLKNQDSSKEERHAALETLTHLLAQEKAEHPEKYEESLTFLYDFLQDVHKAFEK